jgi:Ser/Thr protein kinase RdoA (MazF antagonist)
MTPSTRLTQFSPIFTVSDLGRALAHYASLGFAALAYEGGEYGFAERDGVSLHLTVAAESARPAGAAYLYVEDADALYKEWSSPGREGVTRRPEDTPYLLREGTHHDPDGNLIRFGSPFPDDRVRLRRHLENEYGVEVSQLVALDTGVFRVDRRDGPSWVARRFPPERPVQAAKGDADILRFLAAHDFPAERVAAPEPVSELDGQGVLVTQFVPPVPREERRAAVKAVGGVRNIGELLGRLHTLPEDPQTTIRPGGAWHHLADGGPAEEIAAAVRMLDHASDQVEAGGADLPAALRAEIAALDFGEGLPEALLHPDFVLSNMIASSDRRLIVVDWTGAGRGPRLWTLAFLLFAEGAKHLARVDLVMAGYRRHVDLEPEELRRLAQVARARPLLLAVWAFCHGRRPLVETVREVAEIADLAEQIGERVRRAVATKE